MPRRGRYLLSSEDFLGGLFLYGARLGLGCDLHLKVNDSKLVPLSIVLIGDSIGATATGLRSRIHFDMFFLRTN